MRRITFRAPAVLVACYVGVLNLHVALADDTRATVEQYLLQHYADLDAETGGRVRKIGQRLENVLIYHEDFDQEDLDAYRALIVRVLQDARKGDVGGAIYRNRVILVTPPSLVARAVLPEIEKGGKLEGILRGESNDLREHIQEQQQQGYVGRPSFRIYARFLGSRDPGEHPMLLRHMFSSDPGLALQALISATFDLPYDKADALKSVSDHRRADVERLLFADHVVSDLIWRKRLRLPPSPEQSAAAKQMLRELAGREESWVRLYVAEIMRQNPELYEVDIEAILVKAGDKPIEREPPKEVPPKADAPKVDPPRPDPPPTDTPEAPKPPEKPKKKPRQIPTPASYKPSPHVGDLNPAAVAVELNVPDGEELAGPGPGEVITSFLLLPKDITIIRQFSNRRDEPPAVLAAKGVTAKPIREKGGVPFLFGVGSFGSSGYTHGPPYAPFAGDVLQPGDKAGISLVFNRPQAVVAMTVLSGDVEIDAQAKLVFRDADGRELRAVNADSQWREELSYNHNSAVFRGLALDQPAIKSVDVNVIESEDNQGVRLDYICHSETPLPSISPEHLKPLLEKLASDSFEERAAAQKELIAIGPRLLFALPDDDTIEDDQIRAALETIRQAISASVADPSRGTTAD